MFNFTKGNKGWGRKLIIWLYPQCSHCKPEEDKINAAFPMQIDEKRLDELTTSGQHEGILILPHYNSAGILTGWHFEHWKEAG